MELLSQNLFQFSENSVSEENSILIVFQILKAIDYIHNTGYIHCDLKPENIMINPENLEVKLIDFGSVVSQKSKKTYHENFCTIWYRAPECMLTDGFYDYSIDIWAIGCIFYELITGTTLFPGNNDYDQIFKIHSILGTPQPDVIAQIKKSPRFSNYHFHFLRKIPFSQLMPRVNPLILNLIEQLLAYDPANRISAQNALKHQVFNELNDQERKYKLTSKLISFSNFVLNNQNKKNAIPLLSSRPTPNIFIMNKIQHNPPMIQNVNFHTVIQSRQVNRKSLDLKRILPNLNPKFNRGSEKRRYQVKFYFT